MLLLALRCQLSETTLRKSRCSLLELILTRHIGIGSRVMVIIVIRIRGERRVLSFRAKLLLMLLLNHLIGGKLLTTTCFDIAHCGAIRIISGCGGNITVFQGLLIIDLPA